MTVPEEALAALAPVIPPGVPEHAPHSRGGACPAGRPDRRPWATFQLLRRDQLAGWKPIRLNASFSRLAVATYWPR